MVRLHRRRIEHHLFLSSLLFKSFLHDPVHLFMATRRLPQVNYVIKRYAILLHSLLFKSTSKSMKPDLILRPNSVVRNDFTMQNYVDFLCLIISNTSSEVQKRISNRQLKAIALSHVEHSNVVEWRNVLHFVLPTGRVLGLEAVDKPTTYVHHVEHEN